MTPHDQTGRGLGEWIGFLDVVVEAPGQLVTPCPATGACTQRDDPLYRVNPASSDHECQNVFQRLDPDQCTGQGHRTRIDAWPPVTADTRTYTEALGLKTGSRLLLPGTYTFYLYLFGEGSGPSVGQGALEHLPRDLCEANGPDTQGVYGGHFDHRDDKPCRLITPNELAEHATERNPWTGVAQRPAACLYAPLFTVLAASQDLAACPDGGAFDAYLPSTESSLHVVNRPGWYTRHTWLDHRGGLLAATPLPMAGGPRSDVANLFHAYVNPARPSSHLWCLAPPIATNAPDEIHAERSSDYLVDAHDLDVHLAASHETRESAHEALEGTPADVLDLVPDDLAWPVSLIMREAEGLLEPGSNPTADPLQSVVSRADPLEDPDPEPNHPADDTGRLVATLPGAPCAPTGEMRGDQRAETTYVNRVQATASGTTLADPSQLDEDGLPRESDQRVHNPWHPQAYRVTGELAVFEDRDGDGRFTGCPAGDGPGDARRPDRCVASLPWDLYNPDAVTDDGRPVSTWARSQGLQDPTGLVAVLELTGPGWLHDTRDPTAPSAWVLEEGRHCVVALSHGLGEGSALQGERLLQLNGLEDGSAGLPELAEALCPEDVDQRVVLEDGFEDGGPDGRFATAFTWTRASSSASAADLTHQDTLRLNALITVSPDGDQFTAGNLALGDPDHPTVEQTWEDGAVSYVWTDIDPLGPPREHGET